MNSNAKSKAEAASLIWDRPEPAGRSAPSPLNRDRIVQAAISLADDEGLAAVSLRKVAAALDAGAMRLYGYIATKEELLDLMVDAVYAEVVAGGSARGHWRKRIFHLARRMRLAALRHLWFAELVGGRPHLGPNALAYLESLLGALGGAPGFASIDAVFEAGKIVDAFVIGAIRGEIAEHRAEKESGLSKAEWQTANAPYMERMLATGRFPTLEKVVRDVTHRKPEAVFEEGLRCVLDGLSRSSR